LDEIADAEHGAVVVLRPGSGCVVAPGVEIERGGRGAEVGECLDGVGEKFGVGEVQGGETGFRGEVCNSGDVMI